MQKATMNENIYPYPTFRQFFRNTYRNVVISDPELDELKCAFEQYIQKVIPEEQWRMIKSQYSEESLLSVDIQSNASCFDGKTVWLMMKFVEQNMTESKAGMKNRPPKPRRQCACSGK
jgi:hypothetical protein